jgi:hypothetical protein
MFHARLFKPRIKNIFIKTLARLKEEGYQVPLLGDFLEPGVFSARIMVSRNNFYSEIKTMNQETKAATKHSPVKVYID